MMNRYIQKLIKEQFSVSDIDFSDAEQEYSIDIFNKELNHPYYYKVLNDTIIKNEIIELNSLVNVATARDKDELMRIINYYSENCYWCSLNWLDVTLITDMSHLFENIKYDGDISQWDVSNVTDMSHMFSNAYEFDQPIGDWDVSNVTNMAYMFSNAHKFNQPISKWNVSNVSDMSALFCAASIFN